MATNYRLIAWPPSSPACPGFVFRSAVLQRRADGRSQLPLAMCRFGDSRGTASASHRRQEAAPTKHAATAHGRYALNRPAQSVISSTCSNPSFSATRIDARLPGRASQWG